MEITAVNNFTGYDYAVAKCHLENWGIIFLDEYGQPMDVEEVMCILGEVY